MPGDLAIHAVSPTSGAPPAAQPQAEQGSTAATQARTPVAASTPSAAATPVQAGTAAAASTSASSQSLHTNPVSQLDPALGIVVLSFYNEKGVETSSIPTQKQLESYRLHGDTAAAAHVRTPASSAT